MTTKITLRSRKNLAEFHLGLLALSVLLLAGCASNKNLQPVMATANASGGFELADANHDGKLSREEAIKYSRTRGLTKKAFAEADKNHDGFLDRAEIQAYYASREGNPASH